MTEKLIPILVIFYAFVVMILLVVSIVYWFKTDHSSKTTYMWVDDNGVLTTENKPPEDCNDFNDISVPIVSGQCYYIALKEIKE